MDLLILIYKILLRATALLCAVVGLVYYFFLRPPREPRNIPAVPFWVTLIPLFKDTDQKVLYDRYIKEPLVKHGAIKIFFGSQWNLLVQRPGYVAEVFKHEGDYQKSGNQKKIPGSVLASFLGDNIISSHGEVWRLYQDIMKPGLQGAWTIDAVYTNANLLLEQLNDAVKGQTGTSVAVQEDLQRYTIANLVSVLLGPNLKMMDRQTHEISQLQARIKAQIFRPVFMNFPFLDFLGLRSREMARRDAAMFKDRLVSMVRDGKKSCDGKTSDEGYKPVGYRLQDAWLEGRITDQQLQDNITIVFVAGQENPQLALLSTLYLLAKNPPWQDKICAEISGSQTTNPSPDELNDMLALTACVNESLRLMPPIGQLVNRLAACPLVLGDEHHVPEGTYVGYNSYATNCDPEVWGCDADKFQPERWGDTVEGVRKLYRRRKARAEFITFHGGRRACLGEGFAVLQLKVTLFVLIKNLRWKLDPSWPEKMTPAGPLAPRGLKLVFQQRGDTIDAGEVNGT